MTNNNKGNKGCFFFIFILGLIAVGGYLIYEKFKTNGTAQSSYNSLGEVSSGKHQVQVFTPNVLCSLLGMDENARAGFMYARKFEEHEDKPEQSLRYVFDRNDNYPDDDDWIKFFKDSTCFYLTFHDTTDYKNFKDQFKEIEKTNPVKGCKATYKLGNQCFACDLDFTRKGNGFQVMITRDFEKKKSPFSKPQKQEKTEEGNDPFKDDSYNPFEKHEIEIESFKKDT